MVSVNSRRQDVAGHQLAITGGLSTLRKSVSREKQNFSGNDFAGNRETWKIFQETQSKEVKISGILRFFGEFFPNIGDDIPDFLEDCHLHTVLLKRRLLELSPSVLVALTAAINHLKGTFREVK